MLLMGFERLTFCAGSNRFTHRATTTAHFLNYHMGPKLHSLNIHDRGQGVETGFCELVTKIFFHSLVFHPKN